MPSDTASGIKYVLNRDLEDLLRAIFEIQNESHEILESLAHESMTSWKLFRRMQENIIHGLTKKTEGGMRVPISSGCRQQLLVLNKMIRETISSGQPGAKDISSYTEDMFEEYYNRYFMDEQQNQQPQQHQERQRQGRQHQEPRQQEQTNNAVSVTENSTPNTSSGADDISTYTEDMFEEYYNQYIMDEQQSQQPQQHQERQHQTQTNVDVATTKNSTPKTASSVAERNRIIVNSSSPPTINPNHADSIPRQQQACISRRQPAPVTPTASNEGTKSLAVAAGKRKRGMEPNRTQAVIPNRNALSIEYDARWERHFQRLVEYQKQYKTTQVDYKDAELYKWVYRQREAYKNKKLSRNRKDILNSIGFEWQRYSAVPTERPKKKTIEKKAAPSRINPPRKARWIVENNAEGSISFDDADSDNAGKGYIADNTDAFEGGGENKDSEEVAKISNGTVEEYSLGDILNVKIYDVKWEEKFQLLVEHKKKYQTTKVPQNDPKLKPLRHWIERQRLLYRLNDLPPHRRQRLESIDFAFDRQEIAWEEKFRLLAAYKKKFKTIANVSTTHPEFGPWVLVQQQKYSQNKLSPQQIQRLRSIDFVFNYDAGPGQDQSTRNNHQRKQPSRYCKFLSPNGDAWV